MTTSVAMAVYNGAEFLEEQLETIRLQTKQPDQVVICDDGSNDNSVALVNEYIQRFGLEDRWKLVINEDNLGYVKNFYHAMELCNSDIIFLSDQDDIWSLDKIEKMEEIFAKNGNVGLLSCSHGVVDRRGKRIKGILVPEPVTDEKIVRIDIHAIMVSFLWPGMCMAIRMDCFKKMLPKIEHIDVPHDVSLALMAAKDNSFYEYHYLGALHRRHTNNTGGEEHSIKKVLNLRRKLMEIKKYNTMLRNILSADLGLSAAQRELIEVRLKYSLSREDALENRNTKKLFALYAHDQEKYLRKSSMLCDYFLAIFGDYSSK